MFGVGLRSTHYSKLEQDLSSQLDWFEILTENHLDSDGRPQRILEHIHQRYPLSFHGVSMNIANCEPLSFDYLKRLKTFIAKYRPIIVSDHLCWTGLAHANLHNLLPFPYTAESMAFLRERITLVQDYLERRIALENLSAYFNFKESTLDEWEFLAQLSESADCLILLDINNLYVNSVNHQFDPFAYIDAIPTDRIAQYHLAGFSELDKFLFDTHSKPVYDKVWELYEYALKTKGLKPTLIEWDEDIPDFETLEAEAMKAKSIWKSLS